MLKYFSRKVSGMQMALLLERRELDAGIWRMAVSNQQSVLPAYVCMNLRHGCSSEDHVWHPEDSVPLSALRNEYFVTLPSVHSDWRFLQRVCQQAGFSPMIIRGSG